MNRWLRSTVLTLMFALLTMSVAQAQDTVTLTGKVTTAADGLALPGATVTIPALKLSAETGEDGTYSITVPASDARGQTVEVKVIYFGLQTQSANVVLSGAAPIVRDFGLVFGFHEEITVGSRLAGAAAEKAVPVDILTPQQIETSGASETNQIIQALTPSFNFPAPDDHRRHRHRPAGHPARPRPRPGAGADQRQAPPHQRAGARQRQHRPRLDRRRPQRHPGVGDRAHRDPARRRRRAVRLGRHRRRDQHRAQSRGQSDDAECEGRHHHARRRRAVRRQRQPRLGHRPRRGLRHRRVPRPRRDQPRRAGSARPDRCRETQGTTRRAAEPSLGRRRHDRHDGVRQRRVPDHRPEPRLSMPSAASAGARASHGGFFRRALDDDQLAADLSARLPAADRARHRRSGRPPAACAATASGWFWDASAAVRLQQFDFNVTDSLNVSLGPTSTQQRVLRRHRWGSTSSSPTSTLRAQVDAGLAGPLNVAFGAEFRRESYQIIAGEPNSYIDGGCPNQFGGQPAVPGAQVFPGFRPSNEVDTATQQLSRPTPTSRATSASVAPPRAGRALRGLHRLREHRDGKLTARFQPHPRFVLRGAVSTGFRAPSLGQSYFSAVSTNFLAVGGSSFRSRSAPSRSAARWRARSAPSDLKPEESDHFSAGLVWNPDRHASNSPRMSTASTSRTASCSPATSPAAASAICCAPLGANGARFFTNAIDTRTDGADLTATYTIALDADSRLRLSACATTRPRTTSCGSPTTPPQLAGLEAVLFDRIERRRVECGQPQNNFRFSGDWNATRFGVVGRVARYGEYCSVDRAVIVNGVTVDQDFEAEWITDLEATVSFGKALLGVGIQNLFDVFPDVTVAPNSNSGIFPYPSHSPFGMNGRFVYSRITYRF